MKYQYTNKQYGKVNAVSYWHGPAMKHWMGARYAEFTKDEWMREFSIMFKTVKLKEAESELAAKAPNTFAWWVKHGLIEEVN